MHLNLQCFLGCMECEISDGERLFFAREVKACITTTGFFLCQILNVRNFGKNVSVEDLAFYLAENTTEDFLLQIFRRMLKICCCTGCVPSLI